MINWIEFYLMLINDLAVLVLLFLQCFPSTPFWPATQTNSPPPSPLSPFLVFSNRGKLTSTDSLLDAAKALAAWLPCELERVSGMADPVVNGGDHDEPLPDYDSDAGAQAGDDGQEAGLQRKGLAVRSTGFKEFLLKPEILRSIVDNGFEHPSEGARDRRQRSTKLERGKGPTERGWFGCLVIHGLG